MKAGAGEAIAIVEGGTAEIIRAFAIDEKLDAVAVDDGIAGLLSSERHLVLESGATPFGNADTETAMLGVASRFEQAPELPDRAIRDGNHL